MNVLSRGETASGGCLKMTYKSLALQQCVLYDFRETWTNVCSLHTEHWWQTKKQFHSSLAQWAGECVGVLTGEWLRACFYEQGWLERSYVIPKPPQCGWFAKAALLGTSSQLVGSSAFRKISSPDCYCLHDLGAGLENLASGTCWDLWAVFIFRVLRECFKWRKQSTQQRKSPPHLAFHL